MQDNLNTDLSFLQKIPQDDPAKSKVDPKIKRGQTSANIKQQQSFNKFNTEEEVSKQEESKIKAQIESLKR